MEHKLLIDAFPRNEVWRKFGHAFY